MRHVSPPRQPFSRAAEGRVYGRTNPGKQQLGRPDWPNPAPLPGCAPEPPRKNSLTDREDPWVADRMPGPEPAQCERVIAAAEQPVCHGRVETRREIARIGRRRACPRRVQRSAAAAVGGAAPLPDVSRRCHAQCGDRCGLDRPRAQVLQRRLPLRGARRQQRHRRGQPGAGLRQGPAALAACATRRAACIRMPGGSPCRSSPRCAARAEIPKPALPRSPASAIVSADMRWGFCVKVTSIETLACDAGWRNYHFVKLTTADGIVGWSEFSEDFGSPGIGAVIAQARRQGRRPERQRSRAHLCRALCGDASGRGRRGGAGDRRDRERAARCESESARRAGLRAARRQAARPHSALLVALRDLAHQSSRRTTSRRSPISTA